MCFRAEVFLELRQVQGPRARSEAVAGRGQPRNLSLRLAAAGGRPARPRGGCGGAAPSPGAASGRTEMRTLYKIELYSIYARK